MQGPYLDEALAGFSGCIALDELYEGPWAVLSIVDNRSFRRLICRVQRAPVTQQDVVTLLEELRQALRQRHLVLWGVTTDGSPLYPAALERVFPGVLHQVCRFHAVAGVVLAARRMLVGLYKQLKQKLPPLKRGRPTRREQAKARRRREQQEQLNQLWRHRRLFLLKSPDETEQRTLEQLIGRYPSLGLLRRVLVGVYQLFQSPSPEAASRSLATLRQQAQDLERQAPRKLLSPLLGPSLAKSLVYLGHPQLPPTSNAVERSNRRHRKMQKSVYRVRTERQIRRRLALDLLREQGTPRRQRAVRLLGQQRAGP